MTTEKQPQKHDSTKNDKPQCNSTGDNDNDDDDNGRLDNIIDEANDFLQKIQMLYEAEDNIQHQSRSDLKVGQQR